MNSVTNNQELAAAVVKDPRWAAVVARDPEADGKFFYSVRTTGVYCRPSCAARPARPENVQFHATRAEAERAGFRACKRCRPDQPAPDPVEQLVDPALTQPVRVVDHVAGDLDGERQPEACAQQGPGESAEHRVLGGHQVEAESPLERPADQVGVVGEGAACA